MEVMKMSDNVKEFVKNTLGCQCPEEVFEKIEVDSGIKTGDHTVDRRINVGDRLLIYIVDGDKLPEEDLKRLVIAGKDERDDRDFNRFRLVVMSDRGINLDGLQESVKDYEKVHIHIVSRDLVQF